MVADHSSVILDEEDDVSSVASDIDERNHETISRLHENNNLNRGPLRASILNKISVGRTPRRSSVTNFNRNNFSATIS